MDTLEAELKREEAYVTWFHARIVSGYYKQRLGNVWHGAGEKKPENLFTEEELLKDEIDTMNRHIQKMNEVLDLMISRECEMKECHLEGNTR